MPTRIVSFSAYATLAASAVAAISGTALAANPVNPQFGKASDNASKFTVVALPDTQNYSEFYPDIFKSQTNWIAKNKLSSNIRFVTHVGDVVNDATSSAQWANAKAAMSTLDKARVPYGVAAGNHDVRDAGSASNPYETAKYLKNFGPQNYQGQSWYKGASPTGMSNYQVFTGGGTQFLAMHINVDTPIEELAWAQGVLAANRDKPVMITTHRYLQDAEDYTGGFPIVPSGRYPDIWYNLEPIYSPNGIKSEQFFQDFVRTNKNVFMVNCGHFHEEYRQTSKNAYGQDVHEVLADYQDDANGGNGFMRLMTFDTAANKINVKSYSSWTNEFYTKDESQFSLNVNFGAYGSKMPTRAFQSGINGYIGAKDTWINEDAKNTSYGNDGLFTVDDDTTNSLFNDKRGQGLLRFDGIIGNAPQQIPQGASIASAELRLTLSDDIDNPLANPKFFVYLMLKDWNESSTWNSMSNGLSPGEDYGLLIGEFIGDNSPDGDFLRIIDVTAAVQYWASGGANFGFAIVPEIISGNDDGIDIYSSEAANPLYRPALEVTFVGTIPAPGTLALLAVGGLIASRRRRSA
jgi:Calcineurin-like phosphoesterase